MSRIDDLIRQYAPEGVEYRALGDVGTLVRGRRFIKDDMVEEGVPAIHYGEIYTHYGTSATTTLSRVRKEIAGTLRFAEPGDVVIAGVGETVEDVAKAVAWLGTTQVAIHDDSFAFRSAEDPTYIAYVMQTADFHAQKEKYVARAKVKRVSGDGLGKIVVPVPPIEIQREIVRVLGTFVELEAELETELEAELEARRQQYAHYRDAFLSFAETARVRWATLSEIGRIVTGRTPKSSDKSAWGDEVDFVTPSDIKNGMRTVVRPTRRLSAAGAASMSKVLIPTRSLLVTCIGADMGKTVINANVCVPNQQINAIILTDDGVCADYLFHVLTSMRDALRRQGEQGGGTMPLINKSDFSQVEVPLPNIAEQKRIAGVLDKFDALVNDLSSGLPAEIEARRQQYAYYRDRLLTFKEATA